MNCYCRARLLALTLLPIGVAESQTVVRGRITSGAGPLAGAQVVLDPGPATPIMSDSTGRYSITTENPGRTRLFVRAIGFAPVSRALIIASDDTLALDIQLERSVTALPNVTVEEKAIDPVMREFEERRRSGFGKFFTRDMLAERENSVLSNVVMQTAGVRLVRRSTACGGGFAAASGRSGAVREFSVGGSPTNAGCAPSACYLSVFLDGLPVWTPGSQVPGPPNLDQYYVHSMEAVEVYRSNAEAPIQYQRAGARCGVLLLWTRRPG